MKTYELIAPCHFETSIPFSTTAAFDGIAGMPHSIHTARSVQNIRVNLLADFCLFISQLSSPFCFIDFLW